jgi:hypothetical protein
VSSKYSAAPRLRLVDDDVALTDHAIRRYRERTPADCDVDVRDAYRLGEAIRDREVTRTPGDARIPERAVIYRHAGDWAVVFIVGENDCPPAERPAPATDLVVTTVFDVDRVAHGPSRAYLHAHGPHGGGSA